VQFANINGHLIHYNYFFLSEAAPCFFFINSIGTDFRIWDEVAAVMQGHGSVLLFDNRGHGLSDVVEDTQELNEFTDDAISLLHHLSIKTCFVIGLSLGGMVAQMMASRVPQIIEGLVLCDTASTIGTTSFWNERIDTVKQKGLAAVSDGAMARWFSERFIQEEPAKLGGYKNMLERMPVAGYITACEALRDADVTSIAAKLKLLTLCVVGSEDKSTTPVEVEALANLIEGATYTVIDGSGHLPCVDNPQELSRLIIEFVNAVKK
jgi:3-oxoadipate enol-lactonase